MATFSLLQSFSGLGSSSTFLTEVVTRPHLLRLESRGGSAGQPSVRLECYPVGEN